MTNKGGSAPIADPDIRDTGPARRAVDTADSIRDRCVVALGTISNGCQGVALVVENGPGLKAIPGDPPVLVG